MNKNFEYILEQNAIFLNIVKKSMVDNFTESQFIHETVKKFEADMKAKSIRNLFGFMSFLPIDGTNYKIQNIYLIDKKGMTWNFILTKDSVELRNVSKVYGDYLIEHNKNTSCVKLNKAESILNLPFTEPVINKELVEIAEITTDFDIRKLLGISIESFQFSKEDQEFMDKNKYKTVSDTLKNKIKRFFS